MGNTRIEDESLNRLSTEHIRGDYLGNYVMKDSASVHSSDKTRNDTMEPLSGAPRLERQKLKNTSAKKLAVEQNGCLRTVSGAYKVTPTATPQTKFEMSRIEIALDYA